MSSVFPVGKPALPGGQRGAALILALVVFGIVALLATSLSMDYLVSIRRIENQLHGEQALAYMRGAEGLARSAILRDTASSNTKDHISEGWLDQPQDLPMDTGTVDGIICDLQGRFNLNNLPRSGGAAKPGVYTPDQQMFIRLLQTLPLKHPLDPLGATEVANAVIDWIDADDNINGPGGAESGYYGELDVPYRPGNRPLERVSELRWVKGIDDELYNALAPYVTALPPGVPVNINTASLQVLQSINQKGNLSPISEAEARSIIEQRDGDVGSGNPTTLKQGFNSLADFISKFPVPGLNTAGLDISIRSDYFMLDTRLLYLDRTYTLYSVLHRGSRNVTVIARGQNGLGSCRNEVTSQ